MKKIMLLIVALALYQQWDRIKALVAPAPVAVARSGEVILYSTAWCGYCTQARNFMNAQGIAFSEQDIEKSASARQAYDALGGRGVPVLNVKGTVIHGYDPQGIVNAAR
jgi:glutaredoxin